MTTRTFEHGPYELVCTATPASGGFTAGLVVAISHGDARQETPVPISGGPFDSEDAAIEHAAAQGRDWVDENG